MNTFKNSKEVDEDLRMPYLYEYVCWLKKGKYYIENIQNYLEEPQIILYEKGKDFKKRESFLNKKRKVAYDFLNTNFDLNCPFQIQYLQEYNIFVGALNYFIKKQSYSILRHKNRLENSDVKRDIEKKKLQLWQNIYKLLGNQLKFLYDVIEELCLKVEKRYEYQNKMNIEEAKSKLDGIKFMLENHLKETEVNWERDETLDNF